MPARNRLIHVDMPTLADGDAPSSAIQDVHLPGGMKQLLFVQCGLGVDQHGQDVIKAAKRACCNAIQNNCIPHVEALLPRGEHGTANALKVHVKLGVPTCRASGQGACMSAAEMAKHLSCTNVLQECFPYGKLLPVEVTDGGLSVSSGCKLQDMGDSTDEVVAVVAAVTVGH